MYGSVLRTTSYEEDAPTQISEDENGYADRKFL